MIYRTNLHSCTYTVLLHALDFESTIWSSFAQLFFSHICLNWTCFRQVRFSFVSVFDGNIVWCWYDYCKYAFQWGPKAKGNTKYTLSRGGEFKWSSSTLETVQIAPSICFSNNIQILQFIMWTGKQECALISTMWHDVYTLHDGDPSGICKRVLLSGIVYNR